MFKMTIMTALVVATMAGVGCSSDKSNNNSGNNGQEKVTGMGAFNQDVELTIRNRAGEPDNYVTSTFSFYHLTRDNVELTRNGWDVQAGPGQSAGVDEFHTNMVVGDFGLIADLGEMSCKDIPNQYEQTGEYPGLGKGGYPHRQHRQTDPEFWFQYSDAMDALQNAKENRAQIKKGHCYAIFKLSSDTKVVAVFNVKDYVAGKSVVLSEIEVFEKARVQN